MNNNVGVVIVTYNRLNCLKKTLELFDQQTLLPSYVLVVNNASTDGSDVFLNEWQAIATGYSKYVQHNKENLGGSGGFYTALSLAQDKDADWIWLSDDDAYPHLDAIEQVYKAVKKQTETGEAEKIAAICGQVNNFGKIDIQHRRRIYQSGLKVVEEKISLENYQKKLFELNAFSYIGVVLNREKLKKAGLTEKEYFIWYDDTEHSLRMSQQGRILCVPAIQIDHNVREREKNLVDWKTYYGRRNRIDMIHRHFSKPCYWYNCFKQWINITFFIKGDAKQMAKEALYNARKGILGIHSVYKPGWKPED